MEKINIQDSEVIRNPIEFVDYFAKKSGSSDISTQLFTAILRTLGYETRLVASLQPIPYRIPTHNTTSTKKDPSTSASSSKPSSDNIYIYNSGSNNSSKIILFTRRLFKHHYLLHYLFFQWYR